MIKVENYSRSQYNKDMAQVNASMANIELESIRDIDWYIMTEMSKIHIPVRRLAKRRNFKGFKSTR